LQHRSERPKEELIELLFATLDEGDSGMLLPDELRKGAEACGWEGDDNEWAIQYGELCTEFSINAKTGANSKQFAKILDKKAGKDKATGRELTDLIELLRLKEVRAVVPLESVKSSSSQKAAKGVVKTWKRMSPSYILLREFSLCLRGKCVDVDDAWGNFSSKPFARLSKQDFIDKLKLLDYEGDAAEVFSFLSLGNHFIMKKHFKWVWNLLEAEQLVRALYRLDRRRSTAILPPSLDAFDVDDDDDHAAMLRKQTQTPSKEDLMAKANSLFSADE